MEKIAWFRIKKRVFGDGYQVRVRTFTGEEDTVDIIPDLSQAQRKFDSLLESMIPLSERPI